jgi:protein-S-isoprenylcysteine O-methyltransferase Ste14
MHARKRMSKFWTIMKHGNDDCVMRAFKAGHLLTDGVYGMCRHPIYASWVIFFVPGIVILINTWIGFSVHVIMYFLLRTLVLEEDQYLEKTFGEEYLPYRKKSRPFCLLAGSSHRLDDSFIP